MTGLGGRRLPWLLAACLAFLLAAALPPDAQTVDTEPDFSAWDSVAERAEGVLDRNVVTIERLELLRREVQVWRERFLAAQSLNDVPIETVRSQIEALGPAPEEGATEPEAIAERREVLRARLSTLLAPRLRAEEAFQQAGGIIGQIDTEIRARQTQALLEIAPSPLMPVNWVEAFGDIGDGASGLIREAREALDEPGERGETARRLPLVLFFVVLAGLLIGRGRAWTESLTMRVRQRGDQSGGTLVAFLTSLGQVIIPVAGTLALGGALSLSGVLGPLGELFVVGLVTFGILVFVARWLGTQVFPRADSADGPLRLTAQTRSEGRFYATTLGVLYGLNALLNTLEEPAGLALATKSVLAFPLIVLGGAVLFRLGQLLRHIGSRPNRDPAAGDEGGEDPGFLAALDAWLGIVVMLIAVAAPVLAAVGFYSLSANLIFRTMFTLGLIGLIAILHVVLRDLYAVLARKTPEEARGALLPVLVTFALSVASLPLFALTWGARPADISEFWSLIQRGLTIGEITIAPSDFLALIVVFAVGYGITRFLQSTLKTTILPKTRIDTGGRNAIVAGVGYTGIFIAAVVAITMAGIDLSNLAIIAGALSVGIGFGLQTIVSNFVSGIILLIERPVSEGDWIDVNGQMGVVKDISVRSTRIETFDRTDVIVPNSDLISGTVTNWTRGNTVGRVTLSVGVAYSSDSRRVEEILREICEAHPLVSMSPPPAVFFRRFGADSLEFDCFCILRDVNFRLAVHSDLNHAVHERFREEGIEIPFAQRDLWLRNPESLRGGEAEVKDAAETPPRARPEPRPRDPDPDPGFDQTAGARDGDDL